jgi:RNA polymerase sigma factor (sigma-70 family)
LDESKKKHTVQELERGFRDVYEKYRHAVRGIVQRRVRDNEITRDLVQEVFVRVFRDFDRFDPEKGSLYTWIRALAFQELGHHFQRIRAEKRTADVISIDDAGGSLKAAGRHGKSQTTASQSPLEIADERFDPVRQCESDETYREFLDALEHLSPELQDYVLHYYFYNRTRKQLASRYGVAEATVMRRISAAKVELRRHMRNS